jgi:hypothetical protein
MRRSQGCRFAPTVGLKLANAFGVIFKLNQIPRIGSTYICAPVLFRVVLLTRSLSEHRLRRIDSTVTRTVPA